MTRRTGAVLVVVTLWLGSTAAVSRAQESAAAPRPDQVAPEAEFPTAPVEVDGTLLFPVRGVSAFPAAERAAAIAKRVASLGADPNFDPRALRTQEIDLGTVVVGGDLRVMVVTDADAQIEGVGRNVLAEAYRQRIGAAIEEYRRARTAASLLAGGKRALVATAILAILLVLVVRLARRLDALIERHVRRRFASLGIQSLQLVSAERIWGALRGALRGARALAILALVFFYMEYVLGLFPWTRASAHRLGGYVIGPLASMGRALVAEIPDLIFLAILVVVVRFALRLIRLFFDAVARQEVTFAQFDPAWAWPTYRLVRVAVVAFAVVVAYPYIPGSGSAAFKGISVFLGVIFSLGSSSTIANIIAGYTMTYRRAFRVGDRVRIGEAMGDVTEIRLQVTHLRTVKNEEVIVPNSSILNSEIVNYSTFARAQGLILHTTVGIGYEVPWRQVEAMLLLAAERTTGLLREPPPFVLQKSLGDFAVNYELNASCDDAQAMAPLYTALHRNVLDVFNEYGVQIMTPAYEGDPEQPKVVPKEQWHASPAAAKRTGEATFIHDASPVSPALGGSHETPRS